MLAITSIAPGHKNFESQLTAIKSWQDAGYEVVSLNAPEEIESLKVFEGVKFIPTERHNKKIFGKPYVVVSAIIDYLKEVKSKHSLIVNSDIIIKDYSNYTEKLKEMSEDGIIVMNRRDFDNDMNTHRVYEDGFDGFFVNEKHLDVFPQTILCLGQCHWDFWFPYIATQSGVKITKSTENYLFHKRHNVQYSKQNWQRTGEIVRAEIGMLGIRNVGQVSGMMMRNIKMGFNK
jgi:uncharacterized short protein YbdD (DUF466 family)